jgi:hypothetical protein
VSIAKRSMSPTSSGAVTTWPPSRRALAVAESQSSTRNWRFQYRDGGIPGGHGMMPVTARPSPGEPSEIPKVV